MAEHNIEDHAKVYLKLVDGAWAIDPLAGDGHPLDGIPDGPECVNSDDGSDHGRTCGPMQEAFPDLPNLRRLYSLLTDYFVTTDSPHYITLPDRDGELRIFERNEEEGDLGRMYVLDVFGVSLVIRERQYDTYIHADTVEANSAGGPLVIEVNNGGENHYGG